MATPIYSTLFANVHGLALGAVGVIELPIGAGQIAVVRDIDAVIFAAGGGTIQVYDQDNATFWVDEDLTASISACFQWRGRQVFRPGGTLFVVFTGIGTFLSANHGDFRISGYILSS